MRPDPGALKAMAAALFGAAALLAAGPLAHAAADAAGQPSNAESYRSSDEEYAALKAKAHGGVRMTADTLPDWSGVWIRRPRGPFLSFDESAGPNPELGPQYGRSSAALTPHYQAMYEKKVAEVKKGIEWDRASYCLPVGMPRWLTEPFLREFILKPDQSWLIHEQFNEIRRIYTDGRGHMPEDEAYPLWEGDSIGFWDGDTLVVHTNHMKAGQYQRGQPDYSDQVSTVERIRKIDPVTIEDQVTVYDPVGLAKPWRAVFHYGKLTSPPDIRVQYNVCEENNNVVRTADGTTDFVLPGEPGYKDPDVFGAPPR